MPRIRICIGNQLIESNELEISKYIRVNNHLRRFGVPDNVRNVLKLDWRAVVYFDDLLKGLLSILEDKDQFIRELKITINKIIKNIPSILSENNYILLAVKNYDYKKVIERVGGELSLKIVEVNELGKIEFPYIRFPAEKVLYLIQLLGDPMLPEGFKSILLDLRNSMAERKVIIKEYGIQWIEVEIPILAPADMYEEIRKLGIIKYYSPDPSTSEMVLKEEILYKEHRRDGKIIVRLPAYSIAWLPKICAKYGFYAEIAVPIPKKLRLNIKQNFSLMPHQQEAINAWKNNGNLGTIVIPTGGGKTFIGLAAIAELKIPTIIFVPNKILLWQWMDRISRFLGIPKQEIGILGAGEKIIKDITVATYQSGIKNINKIATRFALAIFDEGHHVPAKTFKDSALFIRAPFRMALSATPKRFDNNEILLFQLAGEVAYKIDYAELVRRGVLAPLAVRKILVPLPPELRLVYEATEKELEKVRDELDRKKKINKLIEIARDNPEKIGVIREIVKRHKDDKIFIFTGSINFAEMVASAIKDIIPVAVLTAKTSESEEKRISRDFVEGKIRALVLVKKGEEGLDVGDASVAIIAGGSKQVREFIQRVGRVLRGGTNKLAWVYEIVSKDTIEEAISRARRARELVRGIEDFIRENFGVKAFRIIRWTPS